jgi:hypothetical protein
LAHAVTNFVIVNQMQQQQGYYYQTWDTEETVIWANSEQLPFTFLDILVEKKIDGSSIHMLVVI